jgi:adenylate cyclase class IV
MSRQYPSTQAITAALRTLGLRARKSTVKGRTQWADFRVRAETNSAGERLYSFVVLHSEATERLVLEHRAEIERITEELGSPWYVTERRSYVLLTTTRLRNIPLGTPV